MLHLALFQISLILSIYTDSNDATSGDISDVNDSLTISTYIPGALSDVISNVNFALFKDRLLPFQMKPNRHIESRRHLGTDVARPGFIPDTTTLCLSIQISHILHLA